MAKEQMVQVRIDRDLYDRIKAMVVDNPLVDYTMTALITNFLLKITQGLDIAEFFAMPVAKVPVLARPADDRSIDEIVEDHRGWFEQECGESWNRLTDLQKKVIVIYSTNPFARPGHIAKIVGCSPSTVDRTRRSAAYRDILSHLTKTDIELETPAILANIMERAKGENPEFAKLGLQLTGHNIQRQQIHSVNEHHITEHISPDDAIHEFMKFAIQNRFNPERYNRLWKEYSGTQLEGQNHIPRPFHPEPQPQLENITPHKG